jgi:hypothetical protein
VSTADQAEIRRLKKEVTELRQTNEILRTASVDLVFHLKSSRFPPRFNQFPFFGTGESLDTSRAYVVLVHAPAQRSLTDP